MGVWVHSSWGCGWANQARSCGWRGKEQKTFGLAVVDIATAGTAGEVFGQADTHPVGGPGAGPGKTGGPKKAPAKKGGDAHRRIASPQRACALYHAFAQMLAHPFRPFGFGDFA
ncbi:hypothetical protein RIE95_17975 [Acidithiobacillus thiooxidans]|uniref:hypothetical protein n=1 Tax=Acidithiobacillus thiooxidans TaxID=930 RepID=UPI0028584483|nr:hypothetical protein [Acidithiobacillus thiooxidans]MDR7928845.1 hypothetical protein [Acidithiobacillus thiooxidans]